MEGEKRGEGRGCGYAEKPLLSGYLGENGKKSRTGLAMVADVDHTSLSDEGTIETNRKGIQCF